MPVVERWLLRRWGRDASARVEDSDRGRGSGRDAVGGRRVRTDCDRMGISAPAGSAVVMTVEGARYGRPNAETEVVHIKNPRQKRTIQQGDVPQGREECRLYVTKSRHR